MMKDKKWAGVRLLFFDLQTVEFAYAEVFSLSAPPKSRADVFDQDYAVSITCTDQLLPVAAPLTSISLAALSLPP